MSISQQLLRSEAAQAGRFFTESEVRSRGRKMFEQYSKLISLFLEINPTPSDAQFHSLAEACGTDKETLEAVAYRMLSELEREEQGYHIDADQDDPDAPLLAEPPEEQKFVEDENAQSFNEQALGDEEEGDTVEAGLLAAMTPGVDDLDMSIDERSVSGDIGQDLMTYKGVTMSDGSLDPKDSTEIQEDTEGDGSYTPFDKGPTLDDGPLVPSVTKRQPEMENITARVLARLARAR